jgi:hypothetical protein
MTDLCPVIDETASVLHQIWQRPRLGIFGSPGLQPIPMLEEQLKHILRIPRISFGPAGRERFPVRGQRGGVDRGEDQKIVLQKRREKGATRPLQADSNLLSGKASAQRSGPSLKIFWSVLEDEGLFRAGRNVKQTDIMLGV